MSLVVARLEMAVVGAPGGAEEGVDLAVLEGVGRILKAEVLHRDVVKGQAVGLENLAGVELHAGARVAHRHSLAGQGRPPWRCPSRGWQ